ncbi:Yip1 family protein [Methanocorpusculum sp.]|uniref:Yip1 family protein n=1 Tax=Methanocorpusculum sp. TaxID=2058474 RepID=UPI00272C60F6|nr:Yip1 family protein [Methanocorpusculum sp.]
MNMKNAVKYLLFDQKQFFEESPKGLLIPALITLIYSLLAVVFILPGDIFTAVITVVAGIIGIFISWAVVAGLFLAGVKILGYAKCTFKQMLAVTGYASAILAIGALLSGLVGLVGTIDPIVSLALQGAVMFWCIPVWIFGIASITELPPKKVFTCILIPIILMIVMSIVSYVITASLTESAALYAGSGSGSEFKMSGSSF